MKIFYSSLVTVGMAVSAVAAPVTRLVPVFAEHVTGVGGSLWQSELRFFNASAEPQVVTMTSLFPGSGSCAGMPPMTIEPGSLVQVRSIRCQDSGFAGFELTSDDSVHIASVITNTGVTEQYGCCLAGYSQNIPVVDTQKAYVTSQDLANLQVAPVNLHNVGRHNLLFVNPNDENVTVTLRYFIDTGTEYDPPSFPYTSITLPPKRYIQINDVLPQTDLPITAPLISGYFRIEASASLPFYLMGSYVDNATGDPTTIESIH